jgi:hypothetical protein
MIIPVARRMALTQINVSHVTQLVSVKLKRMQNRNVSLQQESAFAGGMARFILNGLPAVMLTPEGLLVQMISLPYGGAPPGAVMAPGPKPLSVPDVMFPKFRLLELHLTQFVSLVLW